MTTSTPPTDNNNNTTTSTTNNNNTKEQQQQQPLFTPTSQYSSHVIQTFEMTFGKHYMSAGGCETSRETAVLLQPILSRSVQQGHTNPVKMLEVGCGIGGAAFYFAQQHGVIVHGIDINAASIAMAQAEWNKIMMQQQEQQQQNTSSSSSSSSLNLPNKKGGHCTFQVLDIVSTAANGDDDDDDNDVFEENTYDIIYSRDVLLHLTQEQKQQVFAKFQRWLKPGGMVCVCDYCLGPKSATEGISKEFQHYLNTRGYHLVTPDAYKQLFVQAGFDQDAVSVQDKQLWYCAISQKEMDRITQPAGSSSSSNSNSARDIFLQTHSLQELEKLAAVYSDKIAMTLRGDRSYIMLTATKQAPYAQKRQAVVAAYQQLSARNYIMSCDGNISCRATDNTFLVTPSGVRIADLTADKVVLCHNNGKAVPGELYKPSSESGLHDCIYRARPDVGAVVHSHSIFVCALACCRVPLPPAHYAVCELLQNFDFSSPTGGSTVVPSKLKLEDAVVQCAPYHTYGSRALSQSTLKALGKNHAVIMANHGALVVGATLDEAMYNTERLERECEIYWRCLQMNRPPQPLTLKEIQDLQTADQSYGQDHPDVVVDENDDDKEEQEHKLVGGIDSLDEAPEMESVSAASTSDESE